jgi:hypothetical protein
LVAVLATSLPAEAAPPSARDVARTLADAGYELFQAGKYAEAVAKFDAAEGAFHAPTNLLFLARANAKLGKLVAARALYRRLAAEPITRDAPAVFRNAVTDGIGELQELERRLPRVKLTLLGVPAGKSVHIDVDGVAVGASEVNDAFPVDPGEHTIAASLDGAAGQSQRVQLAAGAPVLSVTFDFTPSTAPPPAAPSVATSVERAPPPPAQVSAAPPAPGSLAPSIAAFVVGAAGLGMGAVTGALAMGKMSDLRAACPKNPCSPVHEGLANDTKLLGNLSTAGFVIGGAGVVTGLILVLVRRSSASGEPSRRAPVAVTLGPGSLFVAGRL